MSIILDEEHIAIKSIWRYPFSQKSDCKKALFYDMFFIANMNITENIQNDEPTTFPSILTKIIVNSVT